MVQRRLRYWVTPRDDVLVRKSVVRQLADQPDEEHSGGVCDVCPGMIRTPMSDKMEAEVQGEVLKTMLETFVPMKREGRPQEIADTVTAEKQRSTQVGKDFGALSPGLVENATDLPFRELWLRPVLAPRDRGLVTVSAYRQRAVRAGHLPFERWTTA